MRFSELTGISREGNFLNLKEIKEGIWELIVVIWSQLEGTVSVPHQLI